MVRSFYSLSLLCLLLILGACASRLKDQMEDYRKAYSAGEFTKAKEILDKSDLKKEEKSQLLWLLETGSVSLALNDFDTAITQFSAAIELIDKLYTKKLSSKAASLLINDASDVFYGASYERSYAHYFLARSYHARFLKTQNKADLQGARATILAWDSYFSELQRSASSKTIYQTDLMLKVFGGAIHEVSEVQNDKQIALQLYKDSLKILDTLGGAFSMFNPKHLEYIKAFEEAMADQKGPPQKLYEHSEAYTDLKNYLHYKILALTKEVRSFDYAVQMKSLAPSVDVVKKLEEGKSNVVIVIEEGLIPKKVAKPFNFGIKGAMGSVENSGAKAFIATVGVEVLTFFAMEKLGMAPTSFNSAGSFVFAHDVTRLAVQEAAIQFELPMIEEVPKLERLSLVISNEAGKVVKEELLPVVSDSGDIAKVVLEEDVVSRYVKTGSRIAVKHIVAIVAAMQVYRAFKAKAGDGRDFFAKAAAMGTYIGAAKGLTALEKADVRHWTTLPQAFRMNEFKLAPGNYTLEITSSMKTDSAAKPVKKKLGSIHVKDSSKEIYTFQHSHL